MPFIRVSTGERLHYREIGEGPPLLLLDGVGGSWVWFKTAPILSQQFRLIILDVLGTGRSDKPPGPYSIRGLARQLIEVILQLGIGPTSVLGLSQGGQIALEAAVQRPDLIGRIVATGTLPGGPFQIPPTPATTARTYPLPFLSPHQNFLRRISTVLSSRYIATHPTELAQIERFVNAEPTPDYVRLAYTAAAATWSGVAGRAGLLRDRVLVVNGELDEQTPLPNARILARQLPGAQLQIFRGSGHLCEIEQPEIFNGLVLSFLLQPGAAGGLS